MRGGLRPSPLLVAVVALVQVVAGVALSTFLLQSN